jgi:Cu/Ag efflux protein CusF
MKTLIFAAALAVLGAGPAALAQHAGHHGAAAASAGATEVADGEIRRIDATRGTVLLRHGEIKSINMGAMTMSFRFKDPKMAEGLKAGDKVRFTVEQKDGDLIITSISKAN